MVVAAYLTGVVVRRTYRNVLVDRVGCEKSAAGAVAQPAAIVDDDSRAPIGPQQARWPERTPVRATTTTCSHPSAAACPSATRSTPPLRPTEKSQATPYDLIRQTSPSEVTPRQSGEGPRETLAKR